MMFAASTLAVFSVGLVFYFMTSFVMAPLSSYITSGRAQMAARHALTTVFAGYSVGAIVGPLAGGILATRLGVRPLFGIALRDLRLLHPAHSAHPRPTTRGLHADQRFRSLLRNRRLGSFLALAFLALFAMYLSWPLTPNYLQSTHGVSLTALGCSVPSTPWGWSC